MKATESENGCGIANESVVVVRENVTAGQTVDIL